MERLVYARLRRWPVKLVDSFSSRAGDVVVTTEYADDPWDAYVPSEEADAEVARRLLAQVRGIHRLGVAHGDLLLKNIFTLPKRRFFLGRALPRTLGLSIRNFRFWLGDWA